MLKRLIILGLCILLTGAIGIHAQSDPTIMCQTPLEVGYPTRVDDSGDIYTLYQDTWQFKVFHPNGTLQREFTLPEDLRQSLKVGGGGSVEIDFVPFTNDFLFFVGGYSGLFAYRLGENSAISLNGDEVMRASSCIDSSNEVASTPPRGLSLLGAQNLLFCAKTEGFEVPHNASSIRVLDLTNNKVTTIANLRQGFGEDLHPWLDLVAGRDGAIYMVPLVEKGLQEEPNQTPIAPVPDPWAPIEHIYRYDMSTHTWSLHLSLPYKNIPGSPELNFRHIRLIGVDEDGALYFIRLHHISKFAPDGTLIWSTERHNLPANIRSAFFRLIGRDRLAMEGYGKDSSQRWFSTCEVNGQ